MGFLEKATDILFKVKGAAPGKAVIIQTLSSGEQERTAEMYHNPGISSMPTVNDRVVSVPIGSASRVIVACHNYRIEVEPSSGETIIYSTNTAGDTVKAKIKLDNAGNITFNEGTKETARKDDGTIIDGVTDAAFIAWIANVSAVLNGLIPGSVPSIPTTATGKINAGTSEVLMP